MEKFEIAATSGFLGFLGGLIGTLAKHLLPSKTRAKLEPQPFDVRLAQEFVSRKEFLEITGELFKRLDEQKTQFSDIRAGFAQQLGSIDGKLAIMIATMQENKK